MVDLKVPIIEASWILFISIIGIYKNQCVMIYMSRSTD